MSRPPPRTPVNKSTAIPRTPLGPTAGTGIAATSPVTSGGRIAAPATPQRIPGTPPTSWSN
eukprot:7928507-Prorocentrum_lima.AAC.1